MNNIGDIFRLKRQENNFSLKDVSWRLKIKESEIELIEKGELDKINRYLYRPNLLRSYAKILKIDEKIIEEEINKLSFNIDIKVDKYKAASFIDNVGFTINKNVFWNFCFISVVLFLFLLAIYNVAEDKSNLLPNEVLIEKMGLVL